jgi:hypothetical protein
VATCIAEEGLDIDEVSWLPKLDRALPCPALPCPVLFCSFLFCITIFCLDLCCPVLHCPVLLVLFCLALLFSEIIITSTFDESNTVIIDILSASFLSSLSLYVQRST